MKMKNQIAGIADWSRRDNVERFAILASAIVSEVCSFERWDKRRESKNTLSQRITIMNHGNYLFRAPVALCVSHDASFEKCALSRVDRCVISSYQARARARANERDKEHSIICVSR